MSFVSLSDRSGPMVTTVEFQLGIGREPVTFNVGELPEGQGAERNESPAILIPRSCSALPEKSMFFKQENG